ncbi:MAG: hypothetical protein KGL35_24880 [Bradyrhizobium sp.]|nr:hypothetical protein [Bradyrhizobium sp.]
MGWDGISIQCGNSAAIGLDIESVHFGAVKNYYGNSCTTADLKIAAVATLGEGNSSQLIDLTNIGGYNGNLGSCILLDGNASGNASFLAPRNVSCTYMNGDGILLNVTDNVVFTNVQETRLPGGTGAGVHFSGNNSIPFSAQNIAFYGLNPGAGGVKADGTPTLTQATASNAIYGYDNGNGAPLPVLGTGAQLFCTYSDGIPCGSSAMVAWTPTIASTVGAFGSTQLLNATYQQLPNKIYFIALSFKITAIGTAAGAMTFTLPSTISQDTVITGVDASTGRQTVCNAAGGSTSLFCTQYDATFAYMTNDTIRIMGWYPSF